MTRAEYESAKHILMEYLQLRIGMEDWHGVWDVAVDLARLQDRFEAFESVRRL